MNKTTHAPPLAFSESNLLPDRLPCPQELRPSSHLASIFEDCHNHLYANEGFLKGVIFHEIVKLLVIKLDDEQNAAGGGPLQFGITAGEYRDLIAGNTNPFPARLNGLFGRIRERHPGLFTDTTLKLRPLTLAYVVGRLQYISLRDTPGDIKGEAFQAFVYRHQRGDRGEFFTPHPIVRLAVEMIAPQPQERIIDPACGSGGS